MLPKNTPAWPSFANEADRKGPVKPKSPAEATGWARLMQIGGNVLSAISGAVGMDAGSDHTEKTPPVPYEVAKEKWERGSRYGLVNLLKEREQSFQDMREIQHGLNVNSQIERAIGSLKAFCGSLGENEFLTAKGDVRQAAEKNRAMLYCHLAALGADVCRTDNEATLEKAVDELRARADAMTGSKDATLAESARKVGSLIGKAWNEYAGCKSVLTNTVEDSSVFMRDRSRHEYDMAWQKGRDALLKLIKHACEGNSI